MTALLVSADRRASGVSPQQEVGGWAGLFNSLDICPAKSAEYINTDLVAFISPESFGNDQGLAVLSASDVFICILLHLHSDIIIKVVCFIVLGVASKPRWPVLFQTWSTIVNGK